MQIEMDKNKEWIGNWKSFKVFEIRWKRHTVTISNIFMNFSFTFWRYGFLSCRDFHRLPCFLGISSFLNFSRTSHIGIYLIGIAAIIGVFNFMDNFSVRIFKNVVPKQWRDDLMSLRRLRFWRFLNLILGLCSMFFN